MRRKGTAVVHLNINNENVSKRISYMAKSSTPLSKPTCLTASLADQPKTVDGVPIVVEACLRYFSTSASKCKRLFRVPGDEELVGQLWQYMQTHPFARLSTKSISLFMLKHPKFTAHEVASFLKRFINSISSGPIVTYSCYEPFLELVKEKCPAHRIGSRFKCIVRQLLVPAHRALLGRLCKFLQEFLKHEEQTRMNAHALAVCFGFLICAPPEISRPRNSTERTRSRARREMDRRESMEYMLAQGEIAKLNVLVIETMIKHAQHIFATSCIPRIHAELLLA